MDTVEHLSAPLYFVFLKKTHIMKGGMEREREREIDRAKKKMKSLMCDAIIHPTASTYIQ